MTLNKTWDWDETKRYRTFFGTLNNYTDDQYMQMITACEPNRTPKCKYVVVGKEIGPENGVHHLHAYVVFKDAQFHRVVCNKYRHWCWEPTKKDVPPQHTIDYVTKGGQWEERGTRPLVEPHREAQMNGGQATKESWERTKELAKQGRLDEIDACHYVVQYGNLKRIANDNQPKPDKLEAPCRKVKFEWWFGEPGTGKSHAADAYLNHTYGDYFDKPHDNKWIDNNTDPTAPWRINDVDLSAKNFAGKFKIWAEESPFRGEDKGTCTWYRPACIIVTSNFAPWEIWGDDHKNLAAIVDRYKIVWWPRDYRPDIYKYDPRIDEIRAPWNYNVAPAAVPPPIVYNQFANGFVPPPVLNRTGTLNAIVSVNQDSNPSIWSPPLQHYNEEANREAIREWVADFTNSNGFL